MHVPRSATSVSRWCYEPGDQYAEASGPSDSSTGVGHLTRFADDLKSGRRQTALSSALLVALAAAYVQPARADDEPPPPCLTPIAVTLADRPGTGRTTSTGGSPCVVTPGEIVVESGLRRQSMVTATGTVILASGPLTFVRTGIANRLELGIALPAEQSRSTRGTTPVDAARGVTDIAVAAKYLALDSQNVQASLGTLYAPPTGTGEFTAGAPTYSVSANLGLALTPRLSFATSQVFGTAIGAYAQGPARSYFAYAPSYTLAYALDGMTTLLAQAALVSRQGPLLPSGDRGFVVLQRALGNRLALDFDYEINFKPILGGPQRALGAGLVWIASMPHGH